MNGGDEEMSQITLDQVSKRYIVYGNVTNALDKIDLKIEQGEMIAIMGPSGSGKSTMLNILGCLDNPTEGQYSLNTERVDKMSGDTLSKVRNQTVGFIFQQFALIDDYTVMENVELPLIYSNMHNKKKKNTKDAMRKKIYEVLTTLGIREHANKYPSQLSGGQQQRVAIARALIAEPDIIIADEPTGALDQKNGAEVMKLLVEINKMSKTVIIVTHDEKVADYCNRRINILDGKVISDTKAQAAC